MSRLHTQSVCCCCCRCCRCCWLQDKKAAEEARKKELAELFATTIKQPKVPAGVQQGGCQLQRSAFSMLISNWAATSAQQWPAVVTSKTVRCVLT
jgi:hypothetical protein